ncbi:MAG: AbrB/MazE/SpoVT family DNA-binding domain-containing protein [Candidatus Peribacteraceae bacterium]|nr:AbrB/MazE/SpoVT family DNA-binding domain-containing protein [Candidatus Peribacteraceae bacterium]
MITATLSLHPNGAVTLPKEWRDKFPTKHYLAEQTSEGLLIKPIMKVEYYENKDGSCGLNFPLGMNMEEFEKEIEKSLQ